jgi:hypothetical protein
LSASCTPAPAAFCSGRLSLQRPVDSGPSASEIVDDELVNADEQFQALVMCFGTGDAVPAA